MYGMKKIKEIRKSLIFRKVFYQSQSAFLSYLAIFLLLNPTAKLKTIIEILETFNQIFVPTIFSSTHFRSIT